MQAFSSWTPPVGTLGAIVAEAVERARALHGRRAELERAAADATDGAGDVPGLAAALRREHVAVIAEVKRRSPSKGWIRAGLEADAQARAYELGGASAISVLTEPAHFGGSNDDLRRVRDAVRIPVLKKDFHVDPIQLVEAKALHASAALLIARALSPEALRRMAETAAALGIEVLVEIRDEAELERALEVDAAIIGVNNRNLETLAIDLATGERLLGLIPPDRVAVGESGVTGRDDVERAASAGADAVLVGSSISQSPDPAAAVAALADVPRTGRRG